MTQPDRIRQHRLELAALPHDLGGTELVRDQLQRCFQHQSRIERLASLRAGQSVGAQVGGHALDLLGTEQRVIQQLERVGRRRAEAQGVFQVLEVGANVGQRVVDFVPDAGCQLAQRRVACGHRQRFARFVALESAARDLLRQVVPHQLQSSGVAHHPAQ